MGTSILLQIHSEEVSLLDEEEREEKEASVTSMVLGVPDTEGSQGESVVIRREDFVQIDNTEDMTELELKDKKVTNLSIVYVCYRSNIFG